MDRFVRQWLFGKIQDVYFSSCVVFVIVLEFIVYGIAIGNDLLEIKVGHIIILLFLFPAMITRLMFIIKRFRTY